MKSIERRPAVDVVLIHPFESQSQVTEDKDEYQDIPLLEADFVSSSSATQTSLQVYS
jgi:hypothetical protein